MPINDSYDPLTLREEGDFQWIRVQDFDEPFLAPVDAYVSWKQENEWDDYNESRHARAFFNAVRVQSAVTIDTHILLYDKSVIAGVLFIVKGNVAALENRFTIPASEKAALIKYFHVLQAYRGRGRKWLTEIVMPFYRQQGVDALYVSSSHPKSFSLYGALGDLVATYTNKSDHARFIREGKSFRIPLQP